VKPAPRAGGWRKGKSERALDWKVVNEVMEMRSVFVWKKEYIDLILLLL